MFIYEGHLGSLFATEEELSYESRYCETCGDCDSLLGEVKTREEAFELLAEDYSIKCVNQFLNDYFD